MGAGDAELVAGLRAGDRQSFAEVYDRYADRLFDFCLAMLRDRDDAADAVHDTMLAAVRRIGQLRDPDRLRPWLYAIARSTSVDRMRARRRTAPVPEVADLPDDVAGPERAAEQEALRALVADAAAGLGDRDRALLHLHLRHGLVGTELAAAVGVGPATVNVRLSRLRDQVERSLGALLVARLGRADCAGLAALLEAWDGRFSPLVRKRVARHVDGCDVCERRRLAAASPWALLAGLAMVPAPSVLRDRVLGSVELVAHAAPAGRAPGTRVRRAGIVAAGLLAGIVVVWSVSAGGPVREVAAGAVPAAGTAPNAPAAALPPTAPASPGMPTTVAPVPPVPVDPLPPGGGGSAAAGPPSREPDPGPAPPTRSPAPQAVTGQQVSPPRISARGCTDDTATVRATVAPAATGTTVVLSWRHAGGGTGRAAMTGSGTVWTGSLGPFAAPGAVTWSVTVTGAGGTATGPDGALTVRRCAPGTVPATPDDLRAPG